MFPNPLTAVMSGAGEKSRTPDLRITNALLYQLSYAGVASALGRSEPRILAEAALALTLTPASSAGGRGSNAYFRANSGSFFATAVFFSVA